MKKITVLFIILSTLLTAQLRVGVDMSRKLSIGLSPTLTAAFIVAGIDPPETKVEYEGMGFTVGYDLMLLSLVGVGGELSLGGGGDEAPPNIIFGYGVAKIPFGIPMARAVIRAGYSLPMEDGMEAGLAYGFGLRIKPPVFPLGAEVHYTEHKLKFEDSALAIGGVMDYKFKYMNIAVTYSF
ncbi:MAG: hypothetical protein QF842_01045 [Candidatus Marinimicrobia bacterium]|jgi:hypothetical protein|nr:hypothetical protein [Candidatus Neomarinimicrobiota bacterium]MDP6611919.1 hypothetical protein [Candidatus Neomarinimicrobiota bacterium]|tara:strand:+ start:63791 stop:64336 length:546 start_codon:yes stop_codon:yes gene_type:complete